MNESIERARHHLAGAEHYLQRARERAARLEAAKLAREASKGQVRS